MKTNRQNKKTRFEKVRFFFQSSTWKKVLAFLFFLVIAFGFWLLLYLQQKFETELSVPVVYENAPEQIVLSDSLPDQIKIKITDKGTALLNYSLGKKIGPIRINLKGTSLDRTSHSVSKSSLDKEISKYLSATTVLLGYTPEKIVVQYGLLKNKVVPVVLNGKIVPASGFMFADSIHIEPPTVLAFGTEEMLDTLQAIYTEYVEEKGLTKMLDKKVKLKLPKGITTDKKEIALSGLVEGYTEKALNIPVTCENLPNDYILRLFPSSVEVSCQVVLSKYSTLVEDSLRINIDYNQLLGNKKSVIMLDLSRKPDWLKNYRISPSSVEFLIEKK